MRCATVSVSGLVYMRRLFKDDTKFLKNGYNNLLCIAAPTKEYLQGIRKRCDIFLTIVQFYLWRDCPKAKIK